MFGLMQFTNVQSDSKLLSGFPFMDHGNTDNNLESLCIMNPLIFVSTAQVPVYKLTLSIISHFINE
jgi:hypothetical protein